MGISSVIPEDAVLAAQASVCQALVDPKRLKLLYLLAGGERTVGDLVEATGLRQANVSQHLAMLRVLGLVRARRAGTFIFYSRANRKVLAACDLLRELAPGGSLLASEAGR